MRHFNVVSHSEKMEARARTRFRAEKKELSFYAGQAGVLILNLGDEHYLAVDAYALMRELERSGAICYGGTYFFELDWASHKICKTDSDEFFDCKTISGEGPEFRNEYLIEYLVEAGRYIPQGDPEDTDSKEQGGKLHRMMGTNVTTTNHPQGWCCVRLQRIEYAVQKGYPWLFSVWRADDSAELGGYIKRYSCSSRDLLELIQSRKLYLMNGGYSLYIQFETGDAYASANLYDRVIQMTPVRSEDYFGMLRIVPTVSALSSTRTAKVIARPVAPAPLHEEQSCCDVDSLCRLLDSAFRSGANVDNQTLIDVVLSYAEMALGSDGMLELLKALEQRGGDIPWACDATGLSEKDLQYALYRLVNGKPQRRYYCDPICVCGRTYYISSQWYSHVNYPNQEQTKKELIQMILRRMSSQCADEYIKRLERKARGK